MPPQRVHTLSLVNIPQLDRGVKGSGGEEQGQLRVGGVGPSGAPPAHACVCFVCVFVYVCMRVCACVYACACTRACLHVCVCVRTCVRELQGV